MESLLVTYHWHDVVHIGVMSLLGQLTRGRPNVIDFMICVIDIMMCVICLIDSDLMICVIDIISRDYHPPA